MLVYHDFDYALIDDIATSNSSKILTIRGISILGHKSKDNVIYSFKHMSPGKEMLNSLHKFFSNNLSSYFEKVSTKPIRPRSFVILYYKASLIDLFLSNLLH